MRRFAYLGLVFVAVAPTRVRSAPAPESKYAKPAVIDAGCEKNIIGVLENIVTGARVGVREDEKVSKLDIVKRQKDLREWLTKNLRVERIPDTNRVRVSFRDGSREEQAAIINVVVDYYLKTDIGQRRTSTIEVLKRARESTADLAARGKLTAAQVAEAEKGFKRTEEYIRTLPVLVERAKPR